LGSTALRIYSWISVDCFLDGKGDRKEQGERGKKREKEGVEVGRL